MTNKSNPQKRDGDLVGLIVGLFFIAWLLAIAWIMV